MDEGLLLNRRLRCLAEGSFGIAAFVPRRPSPLSMVVMPMELKKMRESDIDSLLSHVEGDLTQIKSTYEQSLREKNIPASLQIDVKNVMENLRSCLDYMAQDIVENLIVPHRISSGLSDLKRVYFPYGKDKQSFDRSVSRNLPDVEAIAPIVHALIESIQPHSCGSTWLYDFCSILNENKHNSLSPQERKERQTYKVGRKEGLARRFLPQQAP